MAAYCHPREGGSRFSSGDRGAWYAARAIETAIAECVYHRTAELREVGAFETRVQMRVYLADFSARFHDIRGARRSAAGAVRSGLVRRLAGVRPAAPRIRRQRDRLPQRSGSLRGVPGVFSARARPQRARRRTLRVPVDRPARACGAETLTGVPPASNVCGTFRCGAGGSPLVWLLSLPWVGFAAMPQWSRVHWIPFTDPADRRGIWWRTSRSSFRSVIRTRAPREPLPDRRSAARSHRRVRLRRGHATLQHAAVSVGHRRHRGDGRRGGGGVGFAGPKRAGLTIRTQTPTSGAVESVESRNPEFPGSGEQQCDRTCYTRCGTSGRTPATRS